MNPDKLFAIWVTAIVVAVVAFSGWMSSRNRETVDPGAFAQAVDLSAFDNVAVHTDGRIKSFASFANTMMDYVMGPRSYLGRSPSFMYLDLMFRPDEYTRADIVYVKQKNLRANIIDALEGSPASAEPGFADRMQRFMKRGLVSEELLTEPKVQARLTALRGDLLRFAKFVDMIDSGLAVKSPGVLYDQLRVLPPEDTYEEWSSILDVLGRPSRAAEQLGPERTAELAELFGTLRTAWQAEDAAGVNAASAELAALLPTIEPTVYPSTDRLAAESWYFRYGGLTWVWTIYLVSVICLALSLVYDWRPARFLGIGVFLVAFLMHTGALGLRWYVSGRWPNSNMFEAVTTSAWFGGIAALVLGVLGRRTSMGTLFVLTSGVASMVALMSAHFLPVHLNPNISNMMPVLHDVWLYIHTNVIIASYIVIFMAAVSGMLYLVHRACGGERGYITVGGGMLSLMRSGAGAGGPSEESRRSLGSILDGVTMDLMKMSFVMLWAGLVMGAIWADHSWGRPWGWDPKEVFALNTFLIFAVLVHVRFKAKDKGLWTAALAVVGAGVMLFNWIVINFQISGLHSYA